MPRQRALVRSSRPDRLDALLLRALDLEGVRVPVPAALSPILDGDRAVVDGSLPDGLSCWHMSTSAGEDDDVDVSVKPWEIYRCNDPDRDADDVCGIIVAGSASPRDPYGVKVIRDTDRDECMHGCVSFAVAQHIVDLHNAQFMAAPPAEVRIKVGSEVVCINGPGGATFPVDLVEREIAQSRARQAPVVEDLSGSLTAADLCAPLVDQMSAAEVKTRGEVIASVVTPCMTCADRTIVLAEILPGLDARECPTCGRQLFRQGTPLSDKLRAFSPLDATDVSVAEKAFAAGRTAGALRATDELAPMILGLARATAVLDVVSHRGGVPAPSSLLWDGKFSEALEEARLRGLAPPRVASETLTERMEDVTESFRAQGAPLTDPGSGTTNDPVVEACARVGHEVYRVGFGDPAMLVWDEAPEHEKAVARESAAVALDGVTPEEWFEKWRAKMAEDGWSPGPVKDEERKRHPNLQARVYAELPAEQRMLDQLFVAAVQATAEAFGELEEALTMPVLKVRGDISPEKFADFKREWEQQVASRSSNAWKMPIVDVDQPKRDARRADRARLVELFEQHCECRPTDTARPVHSIDCDTSITDDIRTVLHRIVDGGGEHVVELRAATDDEVRAARGRLATDAAMRAAKP